jgi:hypothetical protein
MLTEAQLWSEPLEFALRLDVEHLGGMKLVAAMLWPPASAAKVDKAAEKLRHCLDEDRPEKLSIAELMLLLHKAREAGAFNGITWINRRNGYKAPELVDLDGEERRVQLEIAHGIEELNSKFRQLQQLQGINEQPGSQPASNVTQFRARGGAQNEPVRQGQ